jgi:hypothetical protein
VLTDARIVHPHRYPGRYLFAEFLERFKNLGPKNLTARAKAASTMYSVPRLALTASDLE